MEKIKALEDAIEKKSLVGIYSVFYTVAHGDPNFSTGKFRELLSYVKSKGIDNFMQEYDGEEFEPEDKWNEDYWALIASSLVDNFCEERINHLEMVGKKVYPIKKSTPVQRNVNKSTNISQTSKQSKSKGQTNRFISKEKKRRVKFENANKTKRDDGGFLSNLLKRK